MTRVIPLSGARLVRVAAIDRATLLIGDAIATLRLATAQLVEARCNHERAVQTGLTSDQAVAQAQASLSHLSRMIDLILTPAVGGQRKAA